MPTQISHIVLANKVYTKFFSGRSRKEFFIGSIFPDIRILKTITRKETHFTEIKMCELLQVNDFIAGIKFHSIIDLLRDQYIKDNNIFALCPKSKYRELALKILEEQVLYSKIDDWSEYISYLDDILPGEQAFRISDKKIKKWHTLLQQHFAKQPSQVTEVEFMSGLGYSSEVIYEINKTVKIMLAKPEIVSSINDLYNNFETLIYGK